MFVVLTKRNPESNYSDEIHINIEDISTMETVGRSSLITMTSGREIVAIEPVDEIRALITGVLFEECDPADDDEEDEDV
jgi:hypothetical protein